MSERLSGPEELCSPALEALSLSCPRLFLCGVRPVLMGELVVGRLPRLPRAFSRPRLVIMSDSFSSSVDLYPTLLLVGVILLRSSMCEIFSCMDCKEDRILSIVFLVGWLSF